MLGRIGQVGVVGAVGTRGGRIPWALDATAEQIRSAIADITRYGYSPHNLLLGSSNTVWAGNFTAGQSNVSSVAVPGFAAGTIVQLATRGSGGDTNVGSTGINNATVGQTITLSSYVWLPSGQTYTQVRMSEDSTLSSPIYRDADLVLRDQWQRISVTGIATGSNVTQALRPTASAGTILYHTAWQTNLGSVQTAYVATTATALGPTTPGWLLPGTAGARIQANARASVAMQVRRDDLLGPELLSAADSDLSSDTGYWTRGGGVTISGGVATASVASAVLSRSTGLFVSGRRYRVEFDCTFTAGANLRIVSSAILQIRPVVNGRMSFDVTADSAAFLLAADGANFTGTIDNVSVREVIVPAGGYEFAPHNLLLWSDDTSNAAYSLSGGTATTSRFTESATNAEHWFQQSNVVPSGAVCTYAIRLSAAGRTSVRLREVFATNATVIADLSAGSIVSQTNGGTGTITALGGGVFRVTLTFVSGATTAALRVNTLDAGQNAVYTGDGTSGVNVFRVMGALGAAITAEVPTTTAAVYAPAIDWLSGIGQYGLRSEEARTNVIRNSAAVGAVPGSPGTLPINGWGTFGSLTQTITAGVTLFGFPAFDIRFQGTFTGQQGLQFDTQRAAATSGQTWTGSVFVALVAGAMTNVSSSLVTSEHDAGGAFLDGNSTSFTATGAGARVVGSRTLNNASTASTQAYFAFNCTGAVDFTVRVACPQLEQGAFATSPILTYGSTATRAADTVDVILPTGLSGLSVYSMIVDYFRGAPVPAGAFPGIARITAAGNTNLLLGAYVPPGLTHRANYLLRNGGAIFDVSAGGSDVSTASRLAMRFQSTLFAASFNGAAVSTNASASFPAGLDTLRLGMLDGNLNGGVTRVRLIGSPISDSSLQALSA